MNNSKTELINFLNKRNSVNKNNNQPTQTYNNNINSKFKTYHNNNIEVENQIISLKSAISLIQKEIKILHNNENYNKDDNLQNYNIFLNQQLSQFNKQIDQLLQKNSFPSSNKKYSFEDIFGMEKEKEELKEIMLYFNSNQLQLANFSRITPKGYLLYGPPGTGKSYLIKALCCEANVHYIELEASRLDHKFIGDGSKALNDIWREAENYDKTIIFIDEIDGLVNRESSTFTDRKNIMNNLLIKLDNIKNGNNKIILIGATNHPDKIDKALRSRFSKEIKIFSKEIKIDILENQQIEPFLKHIIKPYQINYFTFLHLTNIANRCKNKNYSNRDLVSIIDNAYYQANKYYVSNPNHNVMLPSDLDESLDQKQQNFKSLNQINQNRETCEVQNQQHFLL
ncbi:MAG: ATP-binding protein [Vigna little leaf phytoplasma]|nr:ATP-binding protein [Vigna little leaf phytoplasma]